MQLNNILNRKTTLHVKKKYTIRHPYKASPEEVERRWIRSIVRKIMTGDFDATKKFHAMQLGLAIKRGVVERGTLKILMEVL